MTIISPGAEAPAPRRSRARRGIAAAVIGLLALSACSSDPGPKRVAQDIIKAESLDSAENPNTPDLDEECLLAELDEYSNDELTAISEGLEQTGPTQTEAEAALVKYQASLESCLSSAP